MESSKPIPAPAKSLGNIVKNGPAGIQAELIGAPSIHRMFGQPGGTDQILASEAVEQRITGRAPMRNETLERGDDVLDLERKKKGTVIRVLKASAEDGQRRFEIVDSGGNSWKQKESKLKRR